MLQRNYQNNYLNILFLFENYIALHSMQWVYYLAKIEYLSL